MQIESPVLISVSSPFQCLCAIEAINKFSIREYSFWVICNQGKRLDQIKMILERFNIKGRSFIPSPNYIHFLWSYIIKPIEIDKEKFEIGICGDFKNINMQMFLAKYLSKRAKIMYVDDGFTSIYPLNDIVYKDWKIKVRHSLYFVLKNVKGIDDCYFYSIFSYTTKQYTVIRNDLNLLRPSHALKQSGIYIIGTVTQFVNSILPVKDFSDYFLATINWLSKEYPSENIYYSPHGRSVDGEKIKLICQEYNIRTITSKYSVELDYSMKNYNPRVIIGFGSTALITLNKVYPQANVINVFLPSKIELFEKKNKFINEYLKKEGVQTKKVL
jgi:hypothetical protein